MMPMFRVRSSGVCRGIPNIPNHEGREDREGHESKPPAVSYPWRASCFPWFPSLSPAVMRERLVGFGHAVGVFT
ncbi:MAG: hypothetical protein ACREV8_08860, partial [Gammaproteobacteria bacterium]